MPDPVLAEGQFDLSGFTFGGDLDPVLVVPDSFDPGTTGWRAQEVDNPVGDSRLFGRDRLSPGAWAWDLLTNQYNAKDALTTLEVMAGVWRGDSVRNTPGQVLPLRYNLGNGTRRVYGRPRRWAQSVTSTLWQGLGKVSADFTLATAEFYADEAKTIDIGILPGTSRGLTSPLKGPLSTLLAGEQARSVADVGGTAPAPMVAVIYGPIVNPWLSEDGWRLDLNTTLAYDQYVVIDSRPWANTAIRSDGASLAGSQSRTSRISQARLKPGGANLRFGGQDVTGTAHCSVAWRPTFYSI